MENPLNIVTGVLLVEIAVGFCAGWVVGSIFRSSQRKGELDEVYYDGYFAGQEEGRTAAIKEARTAQNSRCSKCLETLPKFIPTPAPKPEAQA